VTFVNKIGKKDNHDLTVNILKRTLVDELAKQYCWADKLKKMHLKIYYYANASCISIYCNLNFSQKIFHRIFYRTLYVPVNIILKLFLIFLNQCIIVY